MLATSEFWDIMGQIGYVYGILAGAPILIVAMLSMLVRVYKWYIRDTKDKGLPWKSERVI